MRSCHFGGPASKLIYTLMSAVTLSLMFAVRSFCDITVAPGQDIQAAINSTYTGTTFILLPGVYRNVSLVPKQGDVFIGQPGAILNGSMLLTSYGQSGAYWTSRVQITKMTAGWM